jgi:hypothetical protein
MKPTRAKKTETKTNVRREKRKDNKKLGGNTIKKLKHKKVKIVNKKERKKKLTYKAIKDEESKISNRHENSEK